MAKFKVQVGYQVFHVAWVEVEARDEQEAQTKAIDKASEECLEYEPDRFDDGGTLQVLQWEEDDQWEEDEA